MKEFLKRRDRAQAVKFNGGEEQAQEIVDWVTELGLKAEYHPEGGQYNAAGVESTSEQIWLFNFWGAMGVDAGEWVVFDPQAFAVNPMTEENFQKTYEEPV